MKNIKNIIFDFGNVLIDLDFTRTEHLFVKYLGEEEYKKVLKTLQQTDIFNRFEIGAISEVEFINSIQNATTLPITGKQVRMAWNGMLKSIPTHRFEMLLDLRKQYNVFLLSNTNAIHMAWIYSYLRRNYYINDWDTRYFDKTYYSHLVKMRKPNLNIYKHVLNDMYLVPEETLFIDDKLENTKAAHKLGIRIITHDPNNEILDILQPLLD